MSQAFLDQWFTKNHTLFEGDLNKQRAFIEQFVKLENESKIKEIKALVEQAQIKSEELERYISAIESIQLGFVQETSEIELDNYMVDAIVSKTKEIILLPKKRKYNAGKTYTGKSSFIIKEYMFLNSLMSYFCVNFLKKRGLTTVIKS